MEPIKAEPAVIANPNEVICSLRQENAELRKRIRELEGREP